MSSNLKAVDPPDDGTRVEGRRERGPATLAPIDSLRHGELGQPAQPSAAADEASPDMPPHPDAATLRPGARLPIAVIALAVASTIALWPSVASLVSLWREIHDYGHGPLLAAIAIIWLILVARNLNAERRQVSLAGAAGLAGCLIVWLVALNSNTQIVHQVLFPLVIWYALLAGLGWPTARRLIAPVAFLYFAVPVWDHFLPVLQRMSVVATETMLGVAGVPAEIHEITVTIPEGTFHINEGCSGKRYFMVTLAVAFLAATVQRMRGGRFVAFVVACGGLALVANYLRIFVVIYAGHATNMQHYLVAKEHITFGNAIFVVLLIVVFLLARRFAPDPVAAVTPVRPAQRHEDAPVGPESRWSIVLPLALLAATFALVQARARSTIEPTGLDPLPLTMGEWQGPLPAQSDWAPRYVQPMAEMRAAYASRAGATVDVYVNLYAEQVQGQELVFYGNSLVAPDGWSREWPARTSVIDAADGNRLVSFQARSGNGEHWVIGYVYEVGGWQTGRESLAQLIYGARSILQPVPSGVVALAARCEPNCEAAQVLVQSFWDDMSSQLLAMVPDRSGH